MGGNWIPAFIEAVTRSEDFFLLLDLLFVDFAGIFCIIISEMDFMIFLVKKCAKLNLRYQDIQICVDDKSQTEKPSFHTN